MAKKIIGFIKLQIPAGKANPSPPIGPALGPRGLNIMEEIAKIKVKDLTAADMDAAVRTIAGTARSMGVTSEGV